MDGSMEMTGDSEMCSSNQFHDTYGQEISEILFGESVNICDIKYLPVRHFATNFFISHCEPRLRRNLDEGRLLA